MRLTHAAATLLSALLALATPGAAHAASDATWVAASNGSDDNDCSYTAPCRTFVGALAKTNPNGIIGAIEPGDYAPTPYQSLVIDKSVTIVGVPGTVITAASAMDGIVFTSSAEQVTLIGLTLNGQNKGGLGIALASGAPTKLTITDCVITNFLLNGVGIYKPSADTRVMVRDSLITNNAKAGIYIEAAPGAVHGLVVKGTTLDMNLTNSLLAKGSGAQVLVSQSRMLRSPDGLEAVDGASVISYGDNIIRNGTGPTSTIPQN